MNDLLNDLERKQLIETLTAQIAELLLSAPFLFADNNAVIRMTNDLQVIAFITRTGFPLKRRDWARYLAK
jgi:hypothetical protein